MRGMKLKNICNFIVYSEIKKIVIKKIETKREGDKNWRGCSEILQGWCKSRGG